MLSNTSRSTSRNSAHDASHYDQAYFDKWYRHPQYRVKSPTALRRQVEFVVYTAEWVLGRRLRSVLDVGCGEGNWQPVLHALRPALTYDGVDPSEYAVARFGARRGLQRGAIEALDTLPLRASYDLVVCCGMLNYLSVDALRVGISQVAARANGVAYLELFTSEDAFEGDTDWPAPQTAAWYRQLMVACGLTPVGLQLYVPDAERGRVSALERL